MKKRMFRLCAVSSFLFLGAAFAQLPSAADELIQELRDLPASVQAFGPSSPDTLKRNAVYSQLLDLDQGAVRALARGLRDADQRIRRQSALALCVLGGGYFFEDDLRQPALDISAALEQLTLALSDPDGRVRELSAQAVGAIGPLADVAVPALIGMLESEAEGDRNSAAIALRGIGPAAQDALPALERALMDTSEDVQNFARLAIESIRSQ